MTNCDGAINNAQSYINNTLPGRLSTLYSSIRAKAPNATVVVVGYPRVFMGEDCNAMTWISHAEQTRLNTTADLLNSSNRAQATANRYSLPHPHSTLTGHAVLYEPQSTNCLANPVPEAAPPNSHSP